MLNDEGGKLPIVIKLAELCRKLLFAEYATRSLSPNARSRTGNISEKPIDVCLKTANALSPTLA
jgi:hypothetical protein